MNTEIETILEQNGWRPDRRVEVAGYVIAAREAVASATIPVTEADFAAAVSFLTRYGDLEVDAGDGEACLNTRLDDVLRGRPLSYFSEAAGRPLFYVGRCYYDFMYLLMDADGAVYRHLEMTSQNFGGIDLYRVADSGEEAIAFLIHEQRAPSDGRDDLTTGVRVAHRD